MKYPEHESHTLEFKQELPKNDQIIKTAIGFCNQAGGRIIIGIEDDGNIIGLAEQTIIEMMEWLESSIYNACSPPILPKVLSQRIGDKLVLVIEISQGMNKPYYRRSEGIEKGTYVRIGTSTLQASTEIIEELKWQSRGLMYDGMPVYDASEDDLDQKKITTFLESRRQKAKITITMQVLKSYKLMTEEHCQLYPTTAGVLCFGKNIEHFFSEAMIICTHFAGTSGRDAIAARDCTGTLFEQFNEAYNFVISRLNHSFVIRGPKREEKLELPEVAVRELILNAIVHRNYHHRAPSKIAIYDDRIEIFSPGGFPTPFPNLMLGLTDVRNTTICKIFREAQYIEKLGTGFITVFNAYEQWQLPKPEIINGNNYVKCILPRESYGCAGVPDNLLAIIKLYYTADELAVSDVMRALDMPRATASRHLAELVSQKRLEKIGRGKATKYRRVKTNG